MGHKPFDVSCFFFYSRSNIFFLISCFDFLRARGMAGSRTHWLWLIWPLQGSLFRTLIRNDCSIVHLSLENTHLPRMHEDEKAVLPGSRRPDGPSSTWHPGCSRFCPPRYKCSPRWYNLHEKYIKPKRILSINDRSNTLLSIHQSERRDFWGSTLERLSASKSYISFLHWKFVLL